MPAQSHLVEVLTGIQTVKAQNVNSKRWKWQEDIQNTYQKLLKRQLPERL